ncbi:hypothetical protein [Streptomyces sp. NPDC002845]
MGIESDQVVFEYLSRVGDLAQQRQLPSATRMRLVSELRNEIDRRRAKTPVDSPAAVRRILARLGSPDEIVTAAGTPGDGDVPETPASVPVQRAGEAEERPKGLRRVVPRPRPADPEPTKTPDDGPSPPHLAGTHELGDSAVQQDWWRIGAGGGPGGDFGLGEAVPGFVGGIEVPELLRPPPEKRERPQGQPEGKLDGDDDRAVEKSAGKAIEKAEPEPAQDVDVARRRPRLPRLLPRGGWSNPLLLLAAALLVAGAVMGSLLPLALGWLIAYLSRRLSPAESKWAVMGLPGLVAVGGIVWLWGRTEGRWGDPIVDGHMNDAITETWPWVLRGAAVASALYLVWRARRA